MEATTTTINNSKATIRPRNRRGGGGGATGATSRSAVIAAVSCYVFLAIILFQLPLFRVPCKGGVCTSPVEITAAQLVTAGHPPLWLAKSLLFPGACVHSVVTGRSLPSWDSVLDRYNDVDDQKPSLLRIEVLAGSYFAVAGALVGMFKRGRMSMFGMLLICWGLIKEGVFSKNAAAGSEVHANPALVIAVALAFLSVKYDLQKVHTLTRPVVKPLKSSTKSKMK